jgi:hypothetical protein
LAKGARGIAETAGGGFLGEALDEDGTEGLILALAGAGRLEEEIASVIVSHGCGPGC